MVYQENKAPHVTGQQLNRIRLEHSLRYDEFAQLLRLKGGKKAIATVKEWERTRPGCYVAVSWNTINILVEKGMMRRPKTHDQAQHKSCY